MVTIDPESAGWARRTARQRRLVALGVAGLSALLGGVVAAGYGQIAIGAVALTVATVLGWRWPKTAAGVIAFAVFFSQPIEALVPQASSLDEAAIIWIAALSGTRFVLLGTQQARRLPGARWFGVFVGAGIASSIIQATPAAIAFQDGFLLMKGVIFCWAVYLMPWTPSDVRYLVRGIQVAIGVVLAGVLLNLLLPAFWYSTFAVTGAAGTRGGLSIPIGPFSHPGFLAQATALLASALVAFALVRRRTPFVTLAAMLLLTIVTLRRKAIVGLLGAVAVIVATDRRARGVTLLVVLVALPIVVVVIGDTLLTVAVDTYDRYAGSESDAPRTLMYQASVELAASSAPFGVGFGRFGTYTAFENYSPVYYALGFDQIYGLEPGADYATDTFWPAILGEVGFFGAAAFFGGLVSLLLRARRLESVASSDPAIEGAPALRLIALVACAWWVEFLIESTAAPVYALPPVAPALFGALGVACALLRFTRAAVPPIDADGGPQRSDGGSAATEGPVPAL